MRAYLSILLLPALCAGGDRVLFDFESGSFQGWTYEGPADKPTFGKGPVSSAEIKQWRSDRDFTGWHGNYLVMVGKTRHESVQPGKLISDVFDLTHPYLKFRFGAEAHPSVKICLLVGGKQVRTAYGNNSYDMRLRGWDVREFSNQKARLLIEDTADVPSLLRVDYFHLSDTPPPGLGDFDLSEQESDILRFGEMRHIISPPTGTFFSYASLVRGADGTWRLFAVQCDNKDRYKPENQKQIVYATAAKLEGPWTLHGPVLTAERAFGEDFLWEPFVMVERGRFYMYYVGSGRPWNGWDKNSDWRKKDFGPGSTQGPFGIHLATSVDGKTWERQNPKPLFTDSPFAFTPFVSRQKDQWVMYYAGAEPANIMGKHAILARTSKDLVNWGDRSVVMADVTDVTPWPEHSFFHDPFVFRRGEDFYLLAGPINNDNQSRFHYRRLYRSSDPLHFDMTVDYKGVFAEGGPKLVEEGGKSYMIHSGRYAGGVWIAPVGFRQPTNPSWAKRRILKPALEDKIRGGWAGQMIGVSYGAPTEFKSNGKINDSELSWSPERVSNALEQDDLYVEMTFAEVMDRKGIDAPIEQFADAFKNSRYMLWHANAAGRRNLLRGIDPRLAGHPKYNLHANDIDFQIEADFIGLMTPGLPQESNKLCDRIGRMVNYGDGLYGGMFVSAMYSAAFFESDPRKVVEAGLAAIPAGSQYAALIRDVLAWYTANPNDWRATWRRIQDKWDRNDPCPKGALNPYNIDAKLNGSYIVLGLLYGGKDFGKTVEITTRSGQDSDCNPSSAAGILGVMLGYRNIPERWKSGIPAIARKKFSHTNYSFEDIVGTTVDRALKVVHSAGGAVFNGQSIEIPVQVPSAPKLEQWDPGIPAELIQTSDARWTWAGDWTPEKEGKTSAPKAVATVHFEGKGIALVGPYLSDGGKADIFLDGKKVATIDAKAAPATSDIDLWHDTDLRPGKHTLMVEAQGKIRILRAIPYR